MHQIDQTSDMGLYRASLVAVGTVDHGGYAWVPFGWTLNCFGVKLIYARVKVDGAISRLLGKSEAYWGGARFTTRKMRMEPTTFPKGL